jgi:hypothetical protein
MDADCLIKLTKAGLKEQVCDAWEVVIPAVVRRETVEQAPRVPDATRIKQNIAAGRIAVEESNHDDEDLAIVGPPAGRGA